MTVTITVDAGTTPAQAFPNAILDVEQLVFKQVQAACALAAGGAPAAVPYYGDGRANQPVIPVRQGWPAFPGKVPAIGVAAGTETEDKQVAIGQGGFAGDIVAYYPDGTVCGSASYYSEPLYSPIVVELIHENRDERDRLHDALRLLLFPLKRKLVAISPRIRQVQVDAEKTDQAGGPPIADEPFHLYISVFTVHVFHELLEAANITDATGVVVGVNETVTPTAVDEPSGQPLTQP